jgi:hypothetical protein
MHRLLLVVVGAAVLGCASAQAATCPAFPPTAIKFLAIPSEVVRDTSKTAKELGAMSTANRALPVSYDHQLSGSALRSVALQTLPDGTVCAALAEITFKLGFKRTLYIAKEFAADSCVAETMADYESPLIKSDDSVLAQFGASIPQAYAADVAAIGTNTDKNKDEVQKPLLAKASALLNDKVEAAFEQQVNAATAKVDVSTWNKASCDGATDRALASINVKPEELKNKNAATAQLPPPRAAPGMNGH